MAEVTTVRYPDFIENAMKNVISETDKLYGQGGPTFYPGDTVADFSPWQQQGQQQLYDQLTGTQPGGYNDSIQKATAANNMLLDPNMLWNPQNIPGYAGVRQGIINDTTRAMNENWMPSVRMDAIANGSFGGSRGQIGEALAAARGTEALTTGLAGLDMSVFNAMLAANQGAIGRAPQMAELALQPNRGLMELGGIQQNQAQSEITGARERHDFEQNAPWWLLDQLRTSAGGVNAGQSSSTSGGGAGTLQNVGSVVGIGAALTDLYKKWFP